MATLANVIRRGLRSAQPSASAVPVGTLYYVTDEGATERSNGTTWDDYSDSGSANTLNGLTDVAVTTPATNDVLVYSGDSPAGWVNTATPRLTRVGIGIAADASAKLLIDGQYGSATNDAGNSSTAITIDWDDGNTQLVTMTGDCTFTLSNPKDGFRYLLVLEQDGSGNHTVTWPSSVKWQAGTAPTLSTAAGKVDIVTLVWVSAIGASGNYLAAANTDYTPA